MSLIAKIKSFYFSLEDKYYNFLDKVNEKIPVYKIVDPIDKVVPSFLLLFAIGLLLIFLLLWFLGGLLSGSGNLFELLFGSGNVFNFAVLDDSGSPLQGVRVTITPDGGEPLSMVSDAFGEFSVSLSSSGVFVKASAEGFKDFSGEMTLSRDSVNEIKFEKSSSGLIEKIIEIRDIENNPLNNSSIRFACSNNFAPPQVIAKGSSIERISVSSKCGILSATVSLDGYNPATKNLNSSRTIFNLQKVATEMLSGKLRVIVEDAGTKALLEGMRVSLTTSGSIYTGQEITDSTGIAVFTPAAGSYFVNVRDPSIPPEYNSGSSSIFTIGAGEEKTINVSMSRMVGEGNKVLVKVVDQDSSTPISGVQVSFFQDGNFSVLDLTASDGTSTYYAADESKSYSVVLTHQDYVLKTAVDLPVINSTDANAFVIKMKKALPQNSGDITVSVVDYSGEPVDEALVTLFADDVDFGILQATANEDGEAVFANMPFGRYYAVASSAGSEGKSNSGRLSVGAGLELTVTLVLQEGSVLVKVIDSENNPVVGALVEFLDADKKVLRQKTTNVRGETEKVSFKWNIKPFLEVSKTGYNTVHTSSIDLLPKTTVTKTVRILMEGEEREELKCDAGSKICIDLEDIIDVSTGRKASSFRKNNNYMLVFRMFADGGFSGAKIAVRTGLETQLTAAESYVVVKSVSPSRYSAIKYKSFNAGNNYSIGNAELTDTDGKQVIISFSEIDSGEYLFDVFVHVKNSVPAAAPLEFRYGVKAVKEDASVVFLPNELSLYIERYLLSESIECDPSKETCPAFDFSFTLENPDGFVTSLRENELKELFKGEEYILSVIVANNDSQRRNFNDLTLSFKPSSAAISPVPSEITGVILPHGTSFEGSTVISADASTNSVDLNVAVDADAPDAEAKLSFKVVDDARMTLTLSKNRIQSGVFSNLVATVTDVAGEKIRDAIVEWATSEEFTAPASFVQIREKAGAYSTTITPQTDGSTVYVRAKKNRFADSALQQVAVTSEPDIDINLEQFKCLKVVLPPGLPYLSIPRNASSSFRIMTENCDNDVQLSFYVPVAPSGNVPAQFVGPITLKDSSNNVITTRFEGVPVSKTLGKNSDSFVVRAYGDKVQGIYDVVVRARFVGDIAFKDVNVVEAVITSDNLAGDKFSIDNPKFDILDGKHSGEITNSAFASNVRDFWIPKISIGDEGVLGYRIEQPKFNSIVPYNITWSVVAKNTAGEIIVTLVPDTTVQITPADIVYNLGTILPPQLEVLAGINPETDAFTIEVINSHPDVFQSWIDGTAESVLYVRCKYVGPDSERSSEIDFDVINESLKGVDRRFLKVRDYASGSISELDNLQVRFNIIEETGDSSNASDMTYEPSIIPNGVPQVVIEAYQPVNSGADVYYRIEESNPSYDVFFKGARDRRLKRISQSDQMNPAVYAVSALDVAGNKKVDLAIVIDTSGSMDPVWKSVCDKKAEIESYLLSEGFDLDLNVFGMGRKRACAESALGWGDDEFEFRPYALIPPRDSLDEAWGATTQTLLNEGSPFAWREGARKMILVIADNDPSGRMQGVFNFEHWRDKEEEKIVENLIQKAREKDVALFFYHPPKFEKGADHNASLKTSDLGRISEDLRPDSWDNKVEDVKELMDWAAEKTGGVSLVYNNASADIFGYNNIIYLVQSPSIEPITNYFHVKVVAGKENVCFSHDGVEGYTGESVVPRIFTTWEWGVIGVESGKIGIDSCDAYKWNQAGVKNENYKYCDAAQFTTEVMQKLKKIQDLSASGNFTDIGKLENFQVYLVKDGYTTDFLNDYLVANTQLQFFNAPTYFTNNSNGLKKLIEQGKVRFNVSNAPSNPKQLPATGIYAVQIYLQWTDPNNPYQFFNAQGISNVNVIVNLTLIDELESDNLFYYMPIDGRVGVSAGASATVARQGYGLGFTGDTQNLSLYDVGGTGAANLSGTSDFGSLSISSGSTFKATNQDFRGRIITISNNAGTNLFELKYLPSRATGVGVVLTNEGQQTSSDVSSFLLLKDGSSDVSSLGKLSDWTKISSTLPNNKPFGSQNVFIDQPDKAYSTYSGVTNCTLESGKQGSAYGFYFANQSIGQVKIGTILYTPTDAYSIRDACSKNTLIYSTASQGAVSSGRTELHLDSSNYSFGSKVASLEQLFELVKDEYVCVATSKIGNQTKTEFWWNPEKVNDVLSDVIAAR